MTDMRIDPAKLREGGRAALSELAVKHEVIDELQELIDGKWHEVYGIEQRVRAILVHLGLMSAGDPFDRHAAAKLLAGD